MKFKLSNLEFNFNAYVEELNKLPDSPGKKKAIQQIRESFNIASLAADDLNHNPPGKVVVRDKNGKVTGLQG